MPDFRFSEFTDQFATTRYPFNDSCNLTADTGQVLDFDMFLDASLFPVGNSGPLYLKTVEVQSRLIRLIVGNTARAAVATAEFDPFTAGDVLSFYDNLGRPAGVIVSDRDTLVRFSSWIEGEHNFEYSATEFAAACVIPTPSGYLQGITVDGELLTGNVLLIGGPGVVFSNEGGKIRMDVVGDPLHRRRLCSETGSFPAPQFIQSINGCSPDAYGNIRIIVGDQLSDKTIIRLLQSGEGLVIEANGTIV